MKQRILIITSVVISMCLSLQAQHNFVVQNGSATNYKTLSEAYEAAVSGDTIYLPGGSFDMPTTIDKSLVWVGVGYNTDSTKATYFTRINNGAAFTGNCDNSYFTGIYFTSTVFFGSSGDDAMDIRMERCRISGNLSLKYNDGDERNTNAMIRECIFDGHIYANKAGNCHFENCVIHGVSYYIRSGVYKGVIFSLGNRNTSSGYTYNFNDAQNCLIINSVFNINTYSSWSINNYYCTGNTFRNNIFAGNIEFPSGTNLGFDNLTGVDLSTVFEYIDGSIADYSYQHDLHLKEGSPAIGAGYEKVDIGIYGGSNPFKEGGLPAWPHIRTADVDLETQNGILHIQFEAGAQDN